MIPLAITETGVDVVPPVGWKNHFTEEEYLDQLEWYDRLLLEDDYVLGATIFAHAGSTRERIGQQITQDVL